MRIDRRELLRRVGGAGLSLPLLAASGAGGVAGVPLLILDLHYPNMFGDLSAGSGLNSLSRVGTSGGNDSVSGRRRGVEESSERDSGTRTSEDY